jgi:hypothetical protein
MGAIANPSHASGHRRMGLRVSLATMASACALGAACSQLPTGPSTAAAHPITIASVETGAAVSALNNGQSWQDFQARGWNCRTPNNGPVTVCSPPNQPLPAIAIPPAQLPDDRPQTVTLKRWRNGLFEANVLLTRPEIYNGQTCESTGQPFSYIVVLGYFECAHIVGR